jgi:putative peptidoglycan lipid II flippase
MVQGLLGYFLLRKKIGGLKGFGVGAALFKFILAAIPATALAIGALWAIGGVGEGSFALDKVVTSILASVLVGGVGLLSYLGLLWLMKVPQLREVSNALGARLKRD